MDEVFSTTYRSYYVRFTFLGSAKLLKRRQCFSEVETNDRFLRDSSAQPPDVNGRDWMYSGHWWTFTVLYNSTLRALYPGDPGADRSR